MSNLLKVAQYALGVASDSFEKNAFMIGDKVVDKATWMQYQKETGRYAAAQNKVKAQGSVFNQDNARMINRMDKKGRPLAEAALLKQKGTEVATPDNLTSLGRLGNRITAMGQRAGKAIMANKGKSALIGAGVLGAAGAGAYALSDGEKAASLDEVAFAKAAAAELYEDALNKIAFAESLWAEADDAFIKIAADNGAGDPVGIGDQMSTSGTLGAIPDNTVMPNGAMSPGALNSFVEQLRKQRALEHSPQ